MDALQAQTQKSRLGFVVAGLLLGIFMASMDNTIVATAMGTIVADLNGFDKFVWVTSAYMVTEMAGMPIFGKLSDMYGRKRFFIFGLAVFSLGSVLCGTAGSIVQLSVYRAIQGIGAGALVPIAFTIMFDVFPVEQRGKMGGLFGAVFGLSSIFGPLFGAFITDHAGWEWVFYVNVPAGLIALFLIAFFYKESQTHTRQNIDWRGAATFAGAVVCLMFALELGGEQYAWNSPVILGLFAGFTVLLAVFLYAETKADEPIISFRMFRNRLFAASSLTALFSGASFIAAAVYIPIFVQGVLGGTATHSGLVLLPMMLGTTVSAQAGAILSTKLGYRNVLIGFGLLFLTGMYLLGTLDTGSSRLAVTVFMIVSGIGIGASFSVIGMSAIHYFDASQRGAASSTVAFLRSLGMTVGITVFGVIQRNDFLGRLSQTLTGSGFAANDVPEPRQLLLPETRQHIPGQVLDKITEALSGSITDIFMWALIPSALMLFSVLFMGGERPATASGQHAAHAAGQRATEQRAAGQHTTGNMQNLPEGRRIRQ